MQRKYSDLMISDSYIFMLCKSEKITEPLIVSINIKIF